MEKCWFKLQQTHYPAPVYTDKSTGTAEGPIRLGQFIPKPSAVDNVINYDSSVPFPPGMRIYTTKSANFSLAHKTTADARASLGATAGVPEANVSANVDVGALFKKAMGGSWAIDRLETQIVQPNLTYLEQCSKAPQLAEWAAKAKFLGGWKVYMVSGLMIARGAKQEAKESRGNEQHISGGVTITDAAKVKAEVARKAGVETEMSGQYLDDFVWAIRLTEVTKTIFGGQLTQNTTTKGATFGPGSDRFDIDAVLAEAGLDGKDLQTIEIEKKGGGQREFLIALDADI